MNSRLREEIGQIAGSVRTALTSKLPLLPKRPDHLYTVARGSSLHASTVLHHLMLHASLPSASLSPSLIQPSVVMKNSVVLAVSQSGASPDLCRTVRACIAQDCPVIGLVNMPDSELELLASTTILQCAGEETSVAATKSMVCSVIMGARLAMQWGASDYDLDTLPGQIEAVQKQPVEELVTFLATKEPLLVIGCGSGYGVAAEIALKSQELLGRPTMAYSPAEVLHGPAGMIRKGYPVLALATGPGQSAVVDCTHKLTEMGADVHILDDATRSDDFAPLLLLTRIYLALELACHRLGRSPDQPVNLSKVTLTE